jgi:hypothetical protein
MLSAHVSQHESTIRKSDIILEFLQALLTEMESNTAELDLSQRIDVLWSLAALNAPELV